MLLSFTCLRNSYAIIMWEVLSRQIPFEGRSFVFIKWFFFYYPLFFICHSQNNFISLCRTEVTNPMQIMFSVLRGTRPDTSMASLPADIPCRETLIDLMISGWTANPDERPSFLSKLTSKDLLVVPDHI